ncbi:hypothetical protein [Cryobacterium luteum]|nr:hypothetical protein [Cryobacterium luteum]SEN54005.1 hypothetical protein SAMN05216281_10971 [Cryobacterium luteum]
MTVLTNRRVVVNSVTDIVLERIAVPVPGAYDRFWSISTWCRTAS